MKPLFELFDPYFIWFFRMSGYTFVDFLVGTFLLALMAVIIGELTISVVFLITRRTIDKVNAEVVKYHSLSEDALSAGDRTSYKAANKLANDAFGKCGFSCSSGCPLHSSGRFSSCSRGCRFDSRKWNSLSSLRNSRSASSASS